MSDSIRMARQQLGSLAFAGLVVLMAACSGTDTVDPLTSSASFNHNGGHGTPPSQITSLAAPVPSVVVEGSTVTISWPAVPNANEYMVVSSAGTTPKTTATSVVYVNVPNGSHTAKVRAKTTASNNESGFSANVAFTVDVPVVTPPPGETPPAGGTPPAGDNTPPVIASPVITGTLGSNGWYTSDVTVTWTATDAESAVNLSGCSVSVTLDTPGTTFTCTATSAGGSSTASITIKRDASTPTVTPHVSGTLGNNDWFVSNVSVSFTVTANGPSGLGSSIGCSPTTVTSDGSFSYVCSAASGAGLSGSATAAGKRDASRPTVTPNVTGTLGTNGWFRSDVSVSFEVTANGPSGLGSSIGCSPTTVTSDGSFSYVCSAASGAGLSSSATAAGKRDATVPTITFVGNLTYTVDETVAISCTATDATSGIYTSTCPSASGAAYLFNIGSNVLLASATDNAGNATSKTTSFTVSVTFGSLCNLTKRFVSHTGIANSLCVKLNAAEAAALRGNLAAKAGPLNAYVKEVQAQTGKSITAANAAILIRLAGLL